LEPAKASTSTESAEGCAERTDSRFPDRDGHLNTDVIKGVVFDVDGTLYFQWPVRLIVLALLIANHFHEPARLVRILKVIRKYRALQEHLRHACRDGGAGPDHQSAMTAALTGETEDFVEWTVEEWIRKRPLSVLRYFVRPGVLDLLRKLCEQGYKVGAYSDYPCKEKLKRMNLPAYFSCVVSSFDRDVLAFKPHRKGFLVCSRKMGLEPREILYIGDRVDVDSVGARRSGMQVVLVGGLSIRFLRSSARIPRYRSFHAIQKAIFDRA
jgi:putative hydrolase of the HAD superfamily